MAPISTVRAAAPASAPPRRASASIPHPRRLRAALAGELAELPGLGAAGELDRFADELLDAALAVAAERALPARRRRPLLSPDSRGFRPRKAIALLAQAGEHEEARWLAFLTAHVGPAPVPPLDPRRWRALRALYGGFGEGRLEWRQVNGQADAVATLCRRHGEPVAALGIGDDGRGPGAGIAAAAAAYLRLAEAAGGQSALYSLGEVPGERFAGAMALLAGVPGLGRRATWFLLTLLGNLGIEPLAPARLHLEPGDETSIAASWLLRGAPTTPSPEAAARLDARASALARRHGLDLQVLERALRHWRAPAGS